MEHQMTLFRALAAAVIFLAALPTYATDWQMDLAASRIELVATFEVGPSPGAFKDFDTRLSLDPGEPAKGSLDVSISVKSADWGNADINKAIAGPEWFDFARFPQAEFHAADIRRLAGDRYLAHGILSLKDKQVPVEVPFAWTESAGVAHMDGEFTVKRAAFGIGTGEWAAANVIGPDVKVKFSVQLHKRA
jgi:polyisoprenoid-binding protein YceI